MVMLDDQLSLFPTTRVRPKLGGDFRRIKQAIKECLIPKEDAILHGVPLWTPFTVSEFKGKNRDHCCDNYAKLEHVCDIDRASVPTKLNPFADYASIGFRKNKKSKDSNAIILVMLRDEVGSLRRALANSGQCLPWLAQVRSLLTPWAVLEYLELTDHPFFQPEVSTIVEVVNPEERRKPLRSAVVPAPTDQAMALPDIEPELPDLLRRSYKEFDMLDEWIAFCDRFPGLKWFVIDGVVLFPIPLVEKLKAENPDIFGEDNYRNDYSNNFAPTSLRVSVRYSVKHCTSQIPLWVKSITEREGTREAYQLKGYEDDPNAVGFVFEGGPHPRHYGKASYEAHQQIGADMGKIGIFHAVTFPVLYAYLVQGRSNISRRAQRLGSTAITQAVKQGIEARRESTPAIDLAAAGAHDPEIAKVIIQYLASVKKQLGDIEDCIKQESQETRNHVDTSLHGRAFEIKRQIEAGFLELQLSIDKSNSATRAKFSEEVKTQALMVLCDFYKGSCQLAEANGDFYTQIVSTKDGKSFSTDPKLEYHHLDGDRSHNDLENCLPVHREWHIKYHSTSEETKDPKYLVIRQGWPQAVKRMRAIDKGIQQSIFPA